MIKRKIAIYSYVSHHFRRWGWGNSIIQNAYATIVMEILALLLQGIGCTKITKATNEDSRNGNVETRAYLEKKLVFCFGPYVASQLLLPFGEENILSSSELKDAQEVVAAFNLLFCAIIASPFDFNRPLCR